MSQSIVLSPANKNTGLLILSHKLVLSMLIDQMSFQISNTFCLWFVRNTIKLHFSRILWQFSDIFFSGDKSISWHFPNFCGNAISSGKFQVFLSWLRYAWTFMNAFYITIIIIVYYCWMLSSLDEVNKKLWTHNNYWSSYKQLQVRHVAEIFPLCYLLVSDSCGVFNCLC